MAIPRRWAALALLSSSIGCGGVSVTVPGANTNPEGARDGGLPPAAAAPARAAIPLSEAEKLEQAQVQSALEKLQSGQISYRIAGADLLEITVFEEKEMDRKVRVSSDGTVTFPLIGSVKVGGLDVAEAERALTERLRRFLVNPQVSVFIKEYGNKQIYILGEVQKPGSYPLPTESSFSVLEAVSLAGGFTQYAALDRTRVIRKADGRSETFVVEITAITKRGEKGKDIALKPNDVIVVPERLF